MITAIAIHSDGTLSRPVIEQISLDDVWGNAFQQLGSVVESLILQSLVEDEWFRLAMRDLPSDEDPRRRWLCRRVAR
jgi:hypothetical protein